MNNSSDRQLDTSLGYYVDRNWLVTFDIEHTRPGDSGSSTQFGVSSKTLLALDTGDYLNIEASYIDLRGTNSSRFAVAGDYYFGKTFALGMEYQWLSKGIFSTDADAVTMRSSWHVSPKMALNAAVTFDSLDTGDDLFQLGLNFRF
ncbi:putative porin [Arsukibacterium sp.]|uniref:putative porin n=1 Tax=Arsukibacterium sp. TaxID=1977258 RepID=UPI002FD8C16C